MATENFNDIPQELKPLTPFLQRAQELKVKDPTMSYWCMYYAVQQGVHLKPRDKTSRNYLLKLMAPLEAARKDPNGVIMDNDAACLYIEDFALRVFDAADNEDRRGDATRGTAKKFLAAANFLELLKVFEENAAGGSNDDAPTQSAFSQHKNKIRYAKWKAADIAKAFREGRQPQPGPANAPEALRMASSGLSVEPMFGPGPGPSNNIPNSNGGSPAVAAFPSDIHGPLGRPNHLSRSSSASTSPHVLSPSHNSRSASLSPRKGNVVLPMTSANPPTNGSHLSQIKPPGMSGSVSQPLTPITNNAPRPFGHGRSHSQSLSYEAGRNMPPPPPKDLLSVVTPVKPHEPQVPGSGLYATQPGKHIGASPGAWSTVATPGGFEDRTNGSHGVSYSEQSSPSRVPEGSKRLDDAQAKSYPPRPYPPTPALPLSQLRALDGHDTDEERAATAAEVNRHAGLPGAARPPTNAAGPVPPNGYGSRLGPPGTSSQGTSPAAGASFAVKIPDNSASSKDTSNASAQKRVRWTPSVVGGSTVASSSPPSSPRSPLGELPTLPESSDSSAGDGKKLKDGRYYTDHPHVSPPTSVDELPAKFTNIAGVIPPKNPYAETPKPPSAQLPPHAPVTKGSPQMAQQSTLPQSAANGAYRRSPIPPTSSTLPSSETSTPKGSGFIPPNAMNSVPVPKSISPPLPAPSAPPATGARPRRASIAGTPESGPTPTSSGFNPPIKPFVPRFPNNLPHSTDSSPSSSTLGNTVSVLGRPRTGTPSSSPPNRTLTPPTSSSPRNPPKTLAFRQINAAKKHSKFAASALEFEDLETARAELLAALAILNGEKNE